MKTFTCCIIFIVSVLLVAGCKKDEETTDVNEDGLTREITDLVPQSVLDEMKRLGMPINGGTTPPLLTQGQLIEVTYTAKPFILKSSNRPGDNPGNTFADYTVTFSQQNNSDLTIKVDYLNGPESGNGLGSYIVGEDCKFSVFVEVNSTHTGGTNAKLVHVISGTLLPTGIENLHFANFMLDNYGNPQGVWIDNEQGRVIYDSDGYSELLGTAKTWYSLLPPCPCTYAEAKELDETKCPAGEWSDCGDADQKFHYGATYEVRWLPSTGGQPGQQCTYDATGKLITGGIAAGSPDKVSPGGCGFWSWLVSGTGTIPAFLGHKGNDIEPWLSENSSSVPCWQYLRDWPSNNTRVCSVNKVSKIEHMQTMIGDMTCEEATLLIRKAKESSTALIDADLRNYIIGVPVSLTNAQIKNKLQSWKENNSCSASPTDALCLVISQAIANLP